MSNLGWGRAALSDPPASSAPSPAAPPAKALREIGILTSLPARESRNLSHRGAGTHFRKVYGEMKFFVETQRKKGSVMCDFRYTDYLVTANTQ